MQLKQIFIAGLITVISLASCSKKKDDVVKPAVTIEGTWVGKHSYLSEPLNNDYRFRFKAGGILERLDANNVKVGEGTWAFYANNTAITGKYSLLPPGTGSFGVIANFDNVTGKLDGTWGYGTNDYNGGYWEMNKVD
jgi:hypothetical protein